MTKLLDISPAIAATLLKAPSSKHCAKTLKAAAKDLTEGGHSVDVTVQMVGTLNKKASSTYDRETVNKKAMENVFAWALQRMTQVEFDALMRGLGDISEGKFERAGLDERTEAITVPLTKTTTVNVTGAVEWTGSIIIGDLDTLAGNDEERTEGITLLIGGA